MQAAWPMVLLVVFVAALAADGGGPADGSVAAAAACDASGADVRGLEACIALHPSDIEAMMDLAGLVAAADAPRAEGLYRRALAVDPMDAEVHVRLAALMLERGRHESAVEHAERALALRPNSSIVTDLLRQARAYEDVSR
jgi:Flp pilus assembly protein TadD